MTTQQKAWWAGAALSVLLILVAIATPNLMRSRIAADEAARFAALAPPPPPPPQARKVQLALFSPGEAADRKLIHNAGLGLTVVDVRAAAGQIRRLAEANHGEIEKLEITETEGGYLSAELVVRVPASGLQSALGAFKNVASRVEREQISTRDVTREYYDNEAHMRNLRAEEEQYLAIMKQARTVKDTLEVVEKLSDVRDRIERLQAQIQLMTHDIDLSSVSIALTQESGARVFGIHWRPLYNAKNALHELLAGLGGWLDWVVAVVIKLPLILAWSLTVGAILWLVWRIGRSIWLRLPKAKADSKAK